jgi:uncharacterized protein involved in exopolysaccharide biosynthesis
MLVSLGSEVKGRADYVNDRSLLISQREQQIRNEQQILQSHDVLLLASKWILGSQTNQVPPAELAEQIAVARRYFTGAVPQRSLVLRAVTFVKQTIGELLDQPPAQEDKEEALARSLSTSLTVTPVFQTDSVDISFRYRDPRVAQTALNLILAAYVYHHIEIFQNTQEAVLLGKERDQSVIRYKEDLKQFAAFMRSQAIYNEDTQVQGLLTQSQKIDSTLSDARANRDAAAAKLTTLDALKQSSQPFERFSTTEARSASKDELTSKLNQALVEQQNLLTTHPVGSRVYEDSQARIDALRRAIDQEPSQVVAQTQQRRSSASELIDSDLVLMNEAQKGEDARIAQLLQEKGRLQSALANYTEEMQGYDALKSQLDFVKQESERIGSAYVESHLRAISSHSGITDISVIDVPSWNSEAASPKRSVVLLSTVAILLFGSVGMLFAFASLDSTMADANAVSRRMGSNLTASLPEMDHGVLGSFENEFAILNSKQFAKIFQATQADPEPRKVILITESNSGEGSSLIGYCLSQFIAMNSNKTVAFIDRSSNQIETSSATQASAIMLNGITRSAEFNDAGRRVGTLVEGFAGISKSYDYLVVSGGPMKDYPELLGLAGITLSTFLIIEAGRTRQASARNSVEVLNSYGFSKVNLVLNRRTYPVPEWLMRRI